jgi:hypothetical protein
MAVEGEAESAEEGDAGDWGGIERPVGDEIANGSAPVRPFGQ